MRPPWLAAPLALLAVLAPGAVRAHDFSPGVLSLLQTAPGRFDLAWTEPVDSQGAPGGVRVVFPSQCRRDGIHLDCGADGLRGEITFEGMHASRMRVLVSIRRLDGTTDERMATGADPQVRVAEVRSGSIWTWLRNGALELVGGLDHVAVVIGLLLLWRADRRAPAAMGAFILGQSLTLALAAAGVLRLPSAPVHALVAASAVLVAREAMHDEPTLAHRAPWTLALALGLVHGVAFAGALGSPVGSVASSVVGFGAGIALAELAVVAVVLFAVRVLQGRLESARWMRPATAYAIGSLGAWWLVARTYAIVRPH